MNQQDEQISFLREQLRNKGKIINSLINQLSKNSEVTQTPVINPYHKKITKENATSVKQKISNNTKTTNNTDLNTSVTKTPNVTVTFTVEKSNEIVKDLSNNTGKINPKSENKQVIRKNNDTKTKISHDFG